MSATFDIFDTKLTIEYRSMKVDTLSLRPRTNLIFRFMNVPKSGQPVKLIFENVCFDLLLWFESNPHYVGRLLPEVVHHSLSGGGSKELVFHFEPDHYTLSQIERFRKGGNLHFAVDLSLVVRKHDGSAIEEKQRLEFRVTKSEWVEEILLGVGFKDVVLLEFPHLASKDYPEIASHLDKAWKQYSMGEYNSVLVECRVALEVLTTKVKKDVGEREVTDKKTGEKRNIPDWRKLLQSKEAGDIVGQINRKTQGYLAPGAHAGKAINKEDAEFALLVTSGIVNLALRKLPST